MCRFRIFEAYLNGLLVNVFVRNLYIILMCLEMMFMQTAR
jgi:hypothetical protein